MSVVVISYNGEKTLGRTLDSVLAQDYPKTRFEVIVVDDGSSDNTVGVASGYKGVRVVRLAKNQGVSGARNAGIKAAKGDIYVAFDDDCIAEPDWLRNLAKGYDQPFAAGVGGQIVEPEPLKGLVRKYIHATGSGTPPQAGKTTGRVSFVRRVSRYVRSCMMPPGTTSKNVPKVVPVEELYGANSSFPMEVIRKVGGWGRDFSGIEDRELSLRIQDVYPSGRLYSVRDAKIIHDPALSLRAYLLRPYRRGPMNLKFHRAYGILPPLFPFPFVLLALAAYAGRDGSEHALAALFLAPQLLYMRWLINFLRTGRLSNLLFPYLQLAEESMVILGLIRGYVVAFKKSNRFARQWLRLGVIGSLLLVAGWVTLELYAPNTVVRTLMTTLFLLTVPGYLALRALIGYTAKLQPSALIAYAVGLSIVCLMATGLATNEILILLGNQHPLTLRPLVYAIGGVTSIAALLAAWRKPSDMQRNVVSWKDFGKLWRWLLPVIVLPFLAAGGAITLNNGGSNWLALTAMGVTAVLFMILLWRKGDTVTRVYPVALYSMALAILLGTSLRGWHITGHDVMQEYQVFQLTLQHTAWHMSYYQDAYNACLSITILPTIFRQLTSMSDPFVYKFIFQLFFALIAPVLYDTLRGFVSKRTALLAAFVFLTFPTFLTDITMLNRQETALLCFVLALQAGLDKALAKRGRILTFVFLVGMVWAHYSTSYVATGTLLLTAVLYGILRLGGRLLRRPSTVRLTIFPLPLILATLVLLITWGGLVTRTSDNIAKTVGGVVASLPNLLDGKSVQSNSPYSRTGAALSNDGMVQEYLLNPHVQQRTLPAGDYYKDAAASTAAIKSKPDTVSPENTVLAQKGVPASLIYSAYDKTKQVYGLLIEGLIVLGTVLAVIRRKWRTKLGGQYLLLIITSLMLIGAQVVLPASLVNYGLLRVIQQSLLVLALPIVLVCLWIMSLTRLSLRVRQRLLGAGLVGVFLVLAGFFPALTGAYKPTLPTSNSGFYYEAYYTHASEIAAGNWIVQQAPKGSRVYSDEFIRRKLIAYDEIFAQPTLSPAAIPIDSYVYLSGSDTRLGSVPAYYNGLLIYYQPPLAFLQANKNLIYSSDGIQIYK